MMHAIGCRWKNNKQRRFVYIERKVLILISDCIGHCELTIDRRIHIIDILFVEAFTKSLYRFAKALEVYNLTSTQEFDYIVDIRIIGKSEDIVISRSCFLLRRRVDR